MLLKFSSVSGIVKLCDNYPRQGIVSKWKLRQREFVLFLPAPLRNETLIKIMIVPSLFFV